MHSIYIAYISILQSWAVSYTEIEKVLINDNFYVCLKHILAIKLHSDQTIYDAYYLLTLSNFLQTVTHIKHWLCHIITMYSMIWWNMYLLNVFRIALPFNTLFHMYSVYSNRNQMFILYITYASGRVCK